MGRKVSAKIAKRREAKSQEKKARKTQPNKKNRTSKYRIIVSACNLLSYDHLAKGIDRPGVEIAPVPEYPAGSGQHICYPA